MDQALSQSYATARDVCRHHARSFYFASIALSPPLRRHAYAVYACCRHLDDEVDLAAEHGRPLDEIIPALESLLQRITSPDAFQPHPQDPPWVAAFRDTLHEKNIPASYFDDLLHGVRMDRESVRIQNWEELRRYCYHVAGVVGLMMTRIFGLDDSRHEAQADMMGTAMQLTNILRDVAADLTMDRIYLPADELAAHDIDINFIRHGRVDDRWRDLMRFQIQRAREFYRNSEPSINALSDPGGRRTTWIMSRVYGGILQEIERHDYDVFSRRHRVSFPRKISLALQAVIASRRPS